MDDIVKEYLLEAFAFIYVINSENASGIQLDTVRHLKVRNVFSFQISKKELNEQRCSCIAVT